MKQFKLINLVLCALLMAGITGCSDKDEDDPGATGTSVKVTVTCVADKSNDSPLELVLTSSHTGEGVYVEPGETFTKEFEVSELPTTAGFVIFPSSTEENGKCGFTVKGEVALMDGKRVVKKETIDDKVTVTDIEAEHTKAYMYEVTPEGMQRVTDFTEAEIPDDDTDSESSGGKESETTPEDFITKKVASAYIVDFTVTHKIDKKDFRDPNKLPKGYDNYKGNVYNVKNYIYPIYDIDNDINYYYVEQHISAAFASSYCGIFNKTFTSDKCHTIGKVCEWYGESINVTTTPKNFTMTTYKNMPESSENKKGYSNSVSVKVDGKAGAGIKDGTVEAAAELAMGYQSTKTIDYTIADVTVENQFEENRQFGWLFNINNWPEVGYAKWNTALTYIKNGAAASRSTLQKTAIFFFQVKGKNLKEFPILHLDLDVVLGSTGAKVNRERGSREIFVSESADILLPYAHKDESVKTKCVYNVPKASGNEEYLHRVIEKPVKEYKVKDRKRQWSDI